MVVGNKKQGREQTRGSILLYVLVLLPLTILLLVLQENPPWFSPPPLVDTVPPAPVRSPQPSPPPVHFPSLQPEQAPEIVAAPPAPKANQEMQPPPVPAPKTPVKKPETIISQPKLPAPVPLPLPPPPSPVSAPVEHISFSAVNARARAALVNIFCLAPSGNRVQGAAGSGIIIDPRGIVLTNAHLANIYLVKDHPEKDTIDCVLRTGSPAVNTYRAELLYISPRWIENNKTAIIEESPVGTGENDFAFLRITEMTMPDATLPSVFPFLPYEVEEETLAVDEPVLIVGYPASFLGSIAVQKDLAITSTVGSITKLFTFDEQGLLDLISVGASILAQKGSSGGAVVRGNGNVTGLIVTSSSGATTAERELHAITLAHVNRVLKKEMGLDLTTFLSADPKAIGDNFNVTLGATLKETLVGVISQ